LVSSLGAGIVEHFSQKELDKLVKRNSKLTEESEYTNATPITHTPLISFSKFL
jgi:hypothetical protein